MQNKYIYLLGKFWNYSEENHLGPSTMLIYLYLLKEAFNRNNEKFSISDVQISKNLNLTKKTIKVNKDILLINGLILFKTKNGVPCNYQIITDYPIETDRSKLKIEKKILTKLQNIRQGVIKKQLKIDEKNSSSFQDQSARDSLQNTKQIVLNSNIPKIEEFLEYAKSLEMYDPKLHSEIQSKYDNWKSNNWKNSANRPITDWKSTLKSVLPYLKNSTQNNSLSVKTIPRITPPKLSNV